MAFPWQKKSKCLMTDDLFLELTWEAGKSPDDDGELMGLIEELDQTFNHQFERSIAETLPYVTFHQAELLFQSLLRAYGHFQLERLAVAHLEGKEAITEGEVFTAPFVITRNYQNLLVQLINSILSESSFKTYSYQEKREYFENQIFPAYKNSVGISDSSLPVFPAEGETIQRSPASPKVNTQPSVTVPVASKSSKGLYALLGVTSLVAVSGLGLSILTLSQLSEKTEQVNYLYHELKEMKHLDSTEHQVDVFSRYFLPNLYSGKKEALADFLSDGDVKYTSPKDGSLQAVNLENIAYDSDSEEYTVTYVVSVKKDEVSESHRLSFDVKTDESSKYGFVITTEPNETDYLQATK